MASAGRGWLGYRIRRDPGKLVYYKKNNHVKKEDVVGDRLRSNSGRLNQTGRRFRRGVVAVVKYL